MPKSRKTADFTKRAQKVGKKKLAPTNATSTRFKVRSVALPEQAQFAADGSIEEPTSHRKLSTTDLLAQLSHYHFEKRSDALKGLTELLTRHPELLPPIAPSVTQRALLTCEDEYARVRGSALALLKVVLPLLHHAGAIGPHEQTLRLRLQSAISHPTRLVRLDALPLLAVGHVQALQYAVIPDDGEGSDTYNGRGHMYLKFVWGLMYFLASFSPV